MVMAAAFCLLASTIICLGRYYSGYRLGQYITQPLHARVDFSYSDHAKFMAAQQRAREDEPRVYRPNPQFAWTVLAEQIRRWPEQVAGKNLAELPEPLKSALDPQA